MNKIKKKGNIVYKILIISFSLFLLCCGEEEETIITYKNQSKNQINPQKNYWICYNPQSEFHGKECSSNFEPGQCLEAGNSSKFCWELRIEDCFSGINLPYNEICSRF